MKTVVIEKFPLFEKYEEKEKFFAAFPKELEPLRGKHVKKARKEYPEKMPVLAFILRKEALVL